MKILQIATTSDTDNTTYVFGLGDDNKIYYWESELGEWVLNN